LGLLAWPGQDLPDRAENCPSADNRPNLPVMDMDPLIIKNAGLKLRE
jgi:hypothetical protein